MIASAEILSTQFIEDLMQDLCADIRNGCGNTPYGELVFESAMGAIHACFPQLSLVVGDLLVRSWVAEFLRVHRSAEPQFFHIATEFVRFANDSLSLSRLQRSVMEYEWLLLAVEVDNARVPASEKMISSAQLWNEEAYLMINPTLSEIGLPFDVNDFGGMSAIREDEKTCNYAVYRSSVHRVYSQRLTDFDRFLLASIRDEQTIKFDSIAQAVLHEAPEDFTERWLSHFCRTDAVIFAIKN